MRAVPNWVTTSVDAVIALLTLGVELGPDGFLADPVIFAHAASVLWE